MKWHWKPIVLNPSRKADALRLHVLRRHVSQSRCFDTFKDQYAEVWEARLRPPESLVPGMDRWIYYSWKDALVHTLEPALFQELRTSRNHNLITKEEQTKLQNAPVAIAGLSVGNTIAAHLMLEGFETLCIADYDVLSLSNLNRLRGSIIDVGVPKVILTARQLYEINPYAHISLFSRGIRTKSDISRFLTKPHMVSLIIDETDSLETKLELRYRAKKERIAIVSAADNDTNAIINVERFDKEPAREVYHGVLRGVSLDMLRSMTKKEKIGIINKMAGERYITNRMKSSLAQIGTMLHTWPQLGGAAAASAAALCYVAKQIILYDDIQSGFYHVDFKKIF